MSKMPKATCVSPDFTGAQVDQLKGWLSTQFANSKGAQPDVNSLSLAIGTLDDAVSNLLGAKPGIIDGDFSKSVFAKLESETAFRFALDPNAYPVFGKSPDM
ncbi:MAG: hypothetical protein AAFX02_05480, partial [Pseudomonadota bacterium]